MRRALLILLIAWVYAGCAGRGPAPVSPLRVALEPADREAALARGGGSPPPGVELAAAAPGEIAAGLTLGRFDAGVVYGARVEGLDAGDASRIPAWDREWRLWVAERGTWVLDPAFRRWLAAAPRVGEWPGLLFAGHASALAAAPPEAGPRRPFDERTRPVLTLVRTGGDTIAGRLQAELDARRVELREAGPRTRRPSMQLLVTRAGDGDPLRALRDVVGRLDHRLADDALARRLERMDESLRHRRERRAAARELERELRDAGRLIPLVREHAYLVRGPAARRLRIGAPGEIGHGRSE